MDFEVKDTKDLQLCSLQEFASVLGYWLTPFGYFEDNLFTDFDCGSEKNRLSFKTMVMLHNQENCDNHGREYERFGFDLYTWNKAKSAKIVHHVNLTANKKNKTVHCHKHLVKFVKPYYEQMFLK
jgi:hypothetical protein